jgi:hypothetical protein
MSQSNFPHEAIGVIDKVLQLGRERGFPDCNWRTLSVDKHFAHAKKHIHDILYGIKTDEDDLAHALTRLAMAVAIRESGQLPPKEQEGEEIFDTKDRVFRIKETFIRCQSMNNSLKCSLPNGHTGLHANNKDGKEWE